MCSVSVAPDGTIALEFEDLPWTRETLAFQSEWLEHSGQLVRYYRLDVLDAEGRHQLWTDHALLSSVGHSSTPTSSVITLKGEAARLSVVYAGPPVAGSGGTARLVKYHTVGFRGFQDDSADFDVGLVTLQGAMNVDDHRRIAGALHVQHSGEDGERVDSWLARCDERVQDILRMVSLGAGRMVAWSARETYVGGALHHIELRGCCQSGPPFDPLFHHLDVGRAMSLAAHNYSRELAARTGLDVAVDWYVMPHSYLEARFLASMTALEHIVSKHATSAAAVLPKQAFRAVSGAMDRVFSAADTRQAVADALRADGVPDEAVERRVAAALAQLQRKLGGINRGSLQDRVLALLAEYGVRHDDVTPLVSELVEARNQIIHRGLRQGGGEQVPLRLLVSAVRELLCRLFLGILGYEGEYTSHLDGPETKHFASMRVP